VLQSALAVTAFGMFVVWAEHDGGYAPEQWLPGGLLSLGLLCTSFASSEVRATLWARRAPLLLFGLYVAWSFASIGWAQVRGDALDGANRTLVYWLVFALFSGLDLGRRAEALILCWGGAVAAAGVVAIIEAANASRPAGHFVLGRLAAPISYPDADAALFLAACLPLLVLASRRGTRPELRLLAGALAVVLIDLAMLCQSRGSAIVLALALLLYVVAARDRLRALTHVVVLAAAAAPAVPALLAVSTSVVDGTDWTAAVRQAGVWIAADAALGVLGFGMLSLLDRRIRMAAATRERVGRALLALGSVAVLASLVLAVAFAHPLSRLETGWRNFSTNHETPPGTPHFASGLGTSRYDVWRIALNQFAAHPVIGVGADNYLVGYLRDRRTFAVSRYPESVELRALSETGIVGAFLFFGFLALALRNLWRAARREYAPGVALACLVGFGYWLLHSSVDWFWEYPALAGPALALLALGAPPRAPVGEESHVRLQELRLAAAGAAAVAVAAVLAVPWVAVSLTDEALAVGPGPRASSLLRTAAALNPVSEQPALAEARLAADGGRLQRESHALESALRRNPSDWYAHFMLGIVAGLRHRPALARAELAYAHRLSPKDNLVHYAQKRLAIREPMTQRQVAAILLEISAPLRGVRQN
jgi:O-Antigen ligase